MYSRLTKDSHSEFDYEVIEEEDDTDEFVIEHEKEWKVPAGFIVNQKRGVKKLLPTSKESFLNWRNEANLKSFHSIHSNMNHVTEITQNRRDGPLIQYIPTLPWNDSW